MNGPHESGYDQTHAEYHYPTGSHRVIIKY